MRPSVQMRVPVQMTRIGPDFRTGPCPSASYLKTKKFKGPKMDSLHFFTFTHKDGGRRSIAGIKESRF